MICKKDFAQMERLLFSNKKILCIGAKNVYKDYILPYCIKKQVLPLPFAIYDILPESFPSYINNIPVLDLKEIQKEDPYSSLIVIAEEDNPFYKVLGKLYDELIAYYFPILPCTSLEAYFYALDHLKEINYISNLFNEEYSQHLYEKYWLSRIYGIVYNPMLYSRYPYFGNNIIPNLSNNDIIVSGGTYNGKHIDRALEINNKISAYLFEPNIKYYHMLNDRFKNNENIKVYNYALYDTKKRVPFDLSDELGAIIVDTDSSYDLMVDTIPLDDLNLY